MRNYLGKTVVHLFLKDAPRFFSDFITALEERFPSCKNFLSKTKSTILDQVVKIYGADRFELWRKMPGIDRREALKVWSTEEEEQRQQLTLSRFKKGIYDALAGVEGTYFHLIGLLQFPFFALRFVHLEKLYMDIIQSIAAKRRKEISPSGEIDLHYHFFIPFDEDQQHSLEVKLHTHQFSEKILTSLDPRTDRACLYPVNAFIEEISIIPPTGRAISSAKLRAGSFDYFGIKTEIITEPLQTHEIHNEIQKLLAMTDDEINLYIKDIRMKRNPKTYLYLVRALESISSSSSSKALEKHLRKKNKYKRELELFLEDRDIINANRQSIENLLDHPNAKKLQFTLPDEVKHALYQQSHSFKTTWAMICLQEPYNVMTPMGVNKFIKHQMIKQGVWPLTPLAFHRLSQRNHNELDSIYREMIAFREACAKKNLECLFFNFPNQWEKKSVLSVEGKKIVIKSGKDINYTISDQVSSENIENETHNSIRLVYERAQKALQLLKMMDSPDSKHYKNTLQYLIHQTFIIDPDTQSIQLKKPNQPEEENEYLARLTLLMEMLNIKIVAQCRSGNNRTAIWIAKCHQLLAVLALSKEGTLPQPQETALVLDPPHAHWSYLVHALSFMPSLEIHKANKGVEGTKKAFAGFKSEALSRAMIRGSFELASFFDEAEMQQARERLAQDND